MNEPTIKVILIGPNNADLMKKEGDSACFLFHFGLEMKRGVGVRATARRGDRYAQFSFPQQFGMAPVNIRPNCAEVDGEHRCH